MLDIEYSEPLEAGHSNSSEQDTKESNIIKQPKATGAKRSSGDCWDNIFVQFKVLVSFRIDPMGSEKDNELMIHFAQEDFFSTFAYSPEETVFPMPFKNLIGKGTDRSRIFRLQQAALMFKTTSEYINLYKSIGDALSCHVSLVSLAGITNQKRASIISRTHSNSSIDSQLTSNASFDGEEIIPLTRKIDERWAILTLRSGSVVGNSKLSGIGLLGIDELLPEKLTSYLEPKKCKVY